MKHRIFWATTAACFGFGVITLTGCGSGAGNGGNNNPPPQIASFTASPATITSGTSAELTAVFANGTGIITPGNIAAVSGVAIAVSPAANTTYTLTVTGAGSTTATQTSTVTVVAAPVISSFTASPGIIAAGGVSNLTATFTGGTGLVAPGDIAVTSGSAVPVTPASFTTYTLTVTNAANTVASQTATVTLESSVAVDPTNPGIAVTDQLLGMNMGAWFDNVNYADAINTSFGQAGIKAIRYPGGSFSDQYHWGEGGVAPYSCQTQSPVTGGYGGPDTFSQYAASIVQAGGYDLALTANYGSDETCTEGGQPSEAAAWAAAALTEGIIVSHMTVGNEEYGSWETDLHPKPNDPATYAAAVTGSTGYYDAIKAASPNTLVGIVADADNTPGGWDDTVMSGARGYYDFVEFHYYPEAPGQENDIFLTQQAAQGLTANINIVKQELANAGQPDTPIYVGEMGSVYSNPGKQSMSITQGLYAGQMLGEMMNDGVSRASWWVDFDNCDGQTGNISSSLYGWQDWGAYNVFSDGPNLDPACPGFGPIGTLSTTARAYELFSNVAVNGEHVLTPQVAGDATNVRAYAATHLGGTALVLFNLNNVGPMPVTVDVNGESSSPDVKVITYDKAIYDQTNSTTPVWADATTTDLGPQPLPLNLTLTPWSMNVVLIK
jgi:hypothetical protein